MLRTIGISLFAALFITSQAQAGTQEGGGSDGRERSFVELSGFEGSEEALGAAVAASIMEISPTKNANHDFSEPVREKRLGHAVATAIRTINVDTPYVHEMNDALVKLHLTYMQFAKDNEMVDKMIETGIQTEFPMLNRVRKLIEKTGNKELAIQAITDRTACFYQLVDDAERGPGSITYQSPYGNVLAATRRLGQHNLTEQEIHEVFTIPRTKKRADILGVDIEVSEWNDDGSITIRLTEAD
ncbi:MAG: hypothetical protein QGH93_10615 [Gammaproteobacteria bacterium]|jgi:hypothetical protein|nr:hypothetical protein [Gammaproteobacteria bacterium]